MLSKTWSQLFSLLVSIALLCTSSSEVTAQLFEAPQGISFGSFEEIVHHEVSDIDGDTDLDILMTFWMDGKMIWMENNGNANFGMTHTIMDDLQGEDDLFALQDLNNDGLEDLVFVDYSDSQLEVYYNENGHFVEMSQTIVLEEDLDEKALSFFDVNEDGLMDILLGTNHELNWYENHDDTQGFTKHFILDDAFQNPWSVGMADLDGNGINEVYAALSNALRIYIPDADGSFSWDNLASTGGSGAQIDFADINCDGYTDLLFSVTIEDRLFSIINGPQGLSDEVTLVAGDLLTVVEFEMADLDGDGQDDITFATAQDPYQNFSLIRCTGFNESIEISNEDFSGATSVEIGDLDGDGLLDVICCALYDNSLYWFKNSGYNMDEGEPSLVEINEEVDIKIIEGVVRANDPNLFPVQVVVYNLNGQLVLKDVLQNNDEIAIDSNSKSLYVVQFITNKGSKKVMKGLF